MSLRIAACAFLLGLALAAPASAAESVYTTLNFHDGSCKPVGPPATQEDLDLGVAALICPGYKNYHVLYNSGDERETVHYGNPETATTDTVWESFLPFNIMADKLEWRLEHGVPFAAIHRFMITVGEQPPPGSADAPVKGQVLVISKVGQPGGPSGCVVGLVDALENADANEMARDIADRLAPGFRCGEDKAVYHGKRGEKAADFQAYFGE